MAINYLALARQAEIQALRARTVQDWLVNQAADELGDTALQVDLIYEWATLEFNAERIAYLMRRLQHKRQSPEFTIDDRNEVLRRLLDDDND